MKTEKKNLRRISIVVTAQTKGNLERLAAVCGYSEIGRVVDKLTREKKLSYYVPYEKRTKENDWYGKDMVLDNEQAKQLADYAVKKAVYNWDGVEWIVTEALAHGNKVVINANW